MDHDDETVKDSSVGKDYNKNSGFETNTIIKSHSVNTENSSNGPAVVPLKASLLKEDTKIGTEPLYDTVVCVRDANSLKDEEQDLLLNTTIPQNEAAAYAILNKINENVHIPSTNCAFECLKSCIIKIERASNIDVEDTRKMNECPKISRLMKDQQRNEPDIISNLENDKYSSVSDKINELCQNTYNNDSKTTRADNEDGKIKTTKKLSKDQQLTNIDNNHENFQHATNKNTKTDKRKISENRKINMLVANEEKELPINGIEDIDKHPFDVNNTDTGNCKELDTEVRNVEQQSSNNDIELIIDEKQSLEGKHENANIKTGENNKTKNKINDITENGNRKEKLCNVKNMEKADVEIEKVNKLGKNHDTKIKRCVLQALPIKQKGRRTRKANLKCTSSTCNIPHLSATVKGGRGRWRDSGSFEVTEKHLVPFKLGWLREVVERATCASPKRMWDVYYRSPDGTKKMRSMPDVISYLKLHPESGLTSENFTFCKMHIYREPFELTRKAKMRLGSHTKTPKSSRQKTKTKSQISKVSIKDKSEVIEDEPPKKRMKTNNYKNESITKEKPVLQVQESKKKEPKKRRTPLILKQKSSHSRKQVRVDVTVIPSKIPNIYEKVYTKLKRPHNDYSRQLRKPTNTTSRTVKNACNEKTIKKNIVKNQNAINESSPILASRLNKKTNKITIKLPAEVGNFNKKINISEERPIIDANLCSNRCPKCDGEIPSLQCIICLCLFHPKCMGLNKASTNFICKRCNAIKVRAEKRKTLPSANSVVQIDSDSTDEDNATNVSVLAPEVVIQHDGSDQDEMIVPTTPSFSVSNAATKTTHTVTSDHSQVVVLNNKNNFIRPAPPLIPFTSLIPCTHGSHFSSRRVITSSTYFPPSISETPIIRVSSNKHHTYSRVSKSNVHPRITSSTSDSCPPLIGNPPVCTSVRLIPPQQLMTVKPPSLTIPRQGLMQKCTSHPPLRLIAPTSISSNVGNSSRIVLPNNTGSCLVFTPPASVLGPGTTTRLLGPFPSNSLPQIMVVNNKVIYVNPVGNHQLSEQRSQSLLTNFASVASPITVCSSNDGAFETRATYVQAQQNNPCLAALLNSKESNTFNKRIDLRESNIPTSGCSVSLSPLTLTDGKVCSNLTSKLTAVIPPSFPVSKNSSISHCSSVPNAITASSLLPSVSLISGNEAPSESHSNELSYSQAQEHTLAECIEERFKLCISVTRTVLTERVSSGGLSTNINKRMETSTTPAIKSPMTTARLLKGTESSLSFLDTKTKSNVKYNDSNPELSEETIKLHVPSYSLCLNRENQQNSKSLDDSSMGAEQNLLGEHGYSSITLDHIRDQPYRTTAISPSFTTLMNTMTSCYSCLNNIFQYLSTTDLLRAKLVCKSWYRLASQQFLWRKVSLKNLTITDWRKFALAIELHGTTYLDLRGHVLFHDTWQNFVSVLNRLDKLRHVECGLIPAFVLYAMASKLMQLKSLTGECAIFSHWTTGKVGPCMINFILLENFREMEKFRLRCKEGLMATVMGGLSPLSHLSKLKHLSLTTLENIDSEQFKFLNNLSNLESLEIGDCSNWTPKIYASIGKMTNLRTLRLEKGGEVDGMVDALSNLTRLKELHLVIYKIPPSLRTALQKLEMLHLLSLWPDTVTHGPFEHYEAFHAVRYLTCLKELRWIILSDCCNSSDRTSLDEGNCWRERLEDYKECQINFSHQNNDIPLIPLPALKNIAKSHSFGDFTRCFTVNGLRNSLQDALPSAEIKMFQVPIKQLKKYSALR